MILITRHAIGPMGYLGWILMGWILTGLSSHSPAQPPFRPPADSIPQCYLLLDRGNGHTIRHQWDEALSCYHKALDVASCQSDRIRIHQNIGCIRFLTSDFDRAAAHFYQAIQWMEALPESDPVHFLNLCMNLSVSYMEMNRLDQAMLWLQRARDIHPDSTGQLSLRLSLLEGNIAFKSGAKEMAMDAYENALNSFPPVFSGLPEEIWLRKDMAGCLQSLSMFDSAASVMHQLVEQVIRLDPEHPMLPELYYFSGHMAVEASRFELAAGLFEEGICWLNAWKEKTSASAGIYTMIMYRLRASRLMVHPFVQPIELAGGPASDQWWLTEANAVLEMGEHYAAVRDRHHRVWTNRILQESVYRICLDYVWTMKTRGDSISWSDFLQLSERAKSFRQAIRKDGRQEQFQLHKQLLSSNPFSEWLFPEEDTLSVFPDLSATIAVAGLQTRDIMMMLEEGEAILSFAHGQTALYALMITQTDVIHHCIAADQHLTEQIHAFRKSLKTGDLPGLIQSGKTIYRQLLLPFEGKLGNVKKMMIFPDENLQQLPFDALPDEEGGFRMLSKEVTYHASLRQWCLHRRKGRGLSRWLPDYTCDFYGYTPGMSGCFGYHPLPEATGEVMDLVMLFGLEGKTVCLQTEGPMDEGVLMQDMAGARIIHLALHGERNQAYPELSGWIISTPPQPSPVPGTGDGKLEVGELQRFRLLAELLTLSSCEVGVNEQHPWYRFTGFPYNFLDAGVQNLLFAVWEVPDKHTRILMSRFYRAYLQGASFASALQQAKRSMLGSPKTAHPTLWASWMLWNN